MPRSRLRARPGCRLPFTTDTDLPFEVAGAVRCERQAQFQPVRYLRGLARELREGGARIHEGTRALHVGGGRVKTQLGPVVNTSHVIVATQLPFVDRSLLFARASVERSYAISLEVNGPLPQAMYLGVDSPSRTLRTIPSVGRDLLLFGGESHRLGHGDPGEAFAALERDARRRFDVVDVHHRWDAHDYMPDDGLPYIGRLTPGSDDLLTVSGGKKWGLAMAAAAGRMLADRIAGRDNEWASTFDPWRTPSLGSLVQWAEHDADSGLQFFAGRLKRGGSASDLAPGRGPCDRARRWPEGRSPRLRGAAPRRIGALHPPRLHRRGGTAPSRPGTVPATARASERLARSSTGPPPRRWRTR